MATTTPGQDFTVPQDSDDPNVPGDLNTLARQIEKRVMAVYATTADRDTRTAGGAAAAEEGMFAFVKANNTVYYYDGAAWVVFPPAQPAIDHGTSLPAASGYNNGDVFFKI